MQRAKTKTLNSKTLRKFVIRIRIRRAREAEPMLARMRGLITLKPMPPSGLAQLLLLHEARVCIRASDVATRPVGRPDAHAVSDTPDQVRSRGATESILISGQQQQPPASTPASWASCSHRC